MIDWLVNRNLCEVLTQTSLACEVTLDRLLELDVSLFQLINLQPHPWWLDGFMLFISDRVVWILFFTIALILALWKRRRNLIAGLVLVGLSVGVTDYVTYQFLKPYFARPRPCHQSLEVRLVQDGCGGDWGFPSNHAANGAAISASVWLYFRNRRVSVVSTVSALGVGVSRIYLGAHFPGDILAGFLVGSVIAVTTWAVYRKRFVVTKLLSRGKHA